MKYQIKNWDKFQQYKDDRPVHWIKLHCTLLDNYEFDALREIDQLHLIKLWLFAGKNKGFFEGSEKFLGRKIGAASLNLKNLIDAGFITRTEACTSSYETVPREEERREEKSRGEKARFTAPTISEINSYSKEKSLNTNGFHDYYESNGWLVGKNKMKDWKASARGWSGRQYGGVKKQQPAAERDWDFITGENKQDVIEGEFKSE